MKIKVEYQEKIRDKILEESKKGNIVLSSQEGFITAKLEEFIKQDTLGLLYDLNRMPEVILTFIDDVKWVNDYAVYQVIKALKNRISDLEKHP